MFTETLQGVSAIKVKMCKNHYFKPSFYLKKKAECLKLHLVPAKVVTILKSMVSVQFLCMVALALAELNICFNMLLSQKYGNPGKSHMIQ